MRTKLPQGPHDSGEYRKGHAIGVDDYGCMEWEWVPIPCGTWNNGKVLCDECTAYYEREYPQGWRYYPGDVCRHGMYVGGCGIDWICGACEMGEE
jgi:hypothetical protein